MQNIFLRRNYLLVLVIGLMLMSTVGAVYAQEGEDELVAYEGPIFVDEPEAVGDVMILLGQVVDVNGNPVEGALVEIWQTDNDGIYDHSGDSDTADRDMNFQFYGSFVTGDDGEYVFRTLVPGLYEPRPRHIHFKVKLDGTELLTSQFYFTLDTNAIDDSILLELTEQVLPDESTVLVAEQDIVVALDGIAAGDDSLAMTITQQEGPYYPQTTVADFDNDLVVASDQETTTAEDDMANTADVPEFTLLNLNTASSDDFKSIPGVGDRMVREFEEYRPYISIAEFRREIGKYVDDDIVEAYEAYVYVPVDINDSDAETLKQLSGVDDSVAASLMDARPYDDNAAFLAELAQYISAEDLAVAPFYLASE